MKQIRIYAIIITLTSSFATATHLRYACSPVPRGVGTGFPDIAPGVQGPLLVCSPMAEDVGSGPPDPIHGGQSQAGRPGPAGPPGLPGPPAVVDYQRIDRVIADSVASAVSKIKPANTPPGATATVSRGSCPLRFRGKCFWYEIPENYVTYWEAEAACESQGGKPANIYSQFHHYMIWEYLRLYARSGIISYAWLGMKYNGDSNTVKRTDGKFATYLKWYPQYPRPNLGEFIYIESSPDRSYVYQHLRNTSPTYNVLGVVCEK